MNQHCVTSQKSEDLIYTAAKAWNHVLKKLSTSEFCEMCQKTLGSLRKAYFFIIQAKPRFQNPESRPRLRICLFSKTLQIYAYLKQELQQIWKLLQALFINNYSPTWLPVVGQRCGHHSWSSGADVESGHDPGYPDDRCISFFSFIYHMLGQRFKLTTVAPFRIFPTRHAQSSCDSILYSL